MLVFAQPVTYNGAFFIYNEVDIMWLALNTCIITDK